MTKEVTILKPTKSKQTIMKSVKYLQERKIDINFTEQHFFDGNKYFRVEAIACAFTREDADLILKHLKDIFN